MPKRLSSPGGADALVCARPPGRALRSFLAHALMRAASTLVSTLGCISHWLWHAALYYTPLNSSPPAKISPRPPLPPQAGASAACSSLLVLAFVLCLSPRLRASALKSFLWGSQSWLRARFPAGSAGRSPRLSPAWIATLVSTPPLPAMPPCGTGLLACLSGRPPARRTRKPVTHAA